jgi:hypothetical protein
METARAIYDTAKTAFPEVYANFAFDSWVGYPVNAGLLTRSGTTPSRLTITPLGQDFLHYLINNSLTAPKAG